MPESTTPAGWYVDPFGQGDGRYWDGLSWTDAVSRGSVTLKVPPDPAQITIPPVPGSGLRAVAPSPVQQTAPRPQPPKSSAALVIVGLIVVIVLAAVIFLVVNNDDSDSTPTSVTVTVPSGGGVTVPPVTTPVTTPPVTESPATTPGTAVP